MSVCYDHCWVLCRTTGKFCRKCQLLQDLFISSWKRVWNSFLPQNTLKLFSLIKLLSSPDVLAFPDFKAALSGYRSFHLVTESSVDGLGAVIEQAQPDSSTRPLWFLSRTTLPNERNWSATELEFDAFVWAGKKNRQLFYRIPFAVVSDPQPPKN